MPTVRSESRAIRAAQVPGSLRLVLAVACVSLGLAPPASAAAPSSKDGWKWRLELTAEGEYDSNVFNLSDNGQQRVKDQSPTNIANGRLRDMESDDDFIISPELELRVSVPNSLGRFSIAPMAAYHRFIENPEKSYPEVALEIRQTLPHRSAVELRASYDIDVFNKNYLKDTIGTGVITDAERIYDRGIYDDLDVDLGYERRLWRTDSTRRNDAYAWATQLTGELRAIYGMRHYTNFRNRDLDTYGGELTLATAFGRNLDVDVSLAFLRYDAPGNSEVTLVDEPDVGIDLDGNGNTTDDNVRTVTKVDRTRNQYEATIKIKLDLTRKLRFWVGGEYSYRDYVSDHFLDVNYHGRNDDQYAAEAGIRWRFAKKWALDMEGGYSNRTTNKSASQVDEEDGLKSGGIARLTLSRVFSF